MKALVTGGAGFIGSHLIDALLKRGYEVRCIDNFSTGRREFIEHNMDRIELIEGDLLNMKDVERSVKGCDIVFHLAANPDVRIGAKNTRVHLEQNIIATYNLLEGMRNEVKKIVFTSSSTVYGEANIIPTPENYAPLIPISMYGASKLAAEALISSYCHTFDMEGIIYRFANVVGPRSTHGVIYDFVNKLRKNNRELEILGDGKQKKSYLYIDDCIDAMLFGLEAGNSEKVKIYNIGSEDWIEVNRIAEIVAEEMGASPKYVYTGGINGRGWKGDVKFMRLSIEKLKKAGWKPKYGSEDAVRLTARWLIINS